MKTIYTTLPIYDSLSKQCFEKVKKANLDKLVPVLCPRHRLPSFQWKDGTDGAATVSNIQLIDKEGNQYNNPTSMIGWTNTNYETFVTSGLNITSAIHTTGGAAWAFTTQKSTYKTGETIEIKGTLVRNAGDSGANIQIKIYTDATGLVQTTNLNVGTNSVTYTFTDDSNVQVMSYVTGNCNFSFISVSINIDWINQYFPTLPASHALASDVYFQYKGDTLNYLLPIGEYYLKITMNTGHVYYSEWFKVDCIYENLLTDPDVNGSDYDTMTISGTSIISAINAAGNADSFSNVIPINIGKTLTIITYLTKISGQLPSINLAKSDTNDASSIVALAEGLNVVTLTATATDPAGFLRIRNTGAASFNTSEILVIKSYSEKYLIIDFHNDCDLGDILYHDGFTQTLWFESEPMETSFPQEEEGVKNGEGRFVKTFTRQTKKYIARTKEMPAFMVEVFNRMKLHDTVELTDLVGDVNDVYNLEVEHDWLWDDKYYAKIDLTFDYDETFVVAGCCNNLV